jgi:hypothetical protein
VYQGAVGFQGRRLLLGQPQQKVSRRRAPTLAG